MLHILLLWAHVLWRFINAEPTHAIHPSIRLRTSTGMANILELVNHSPRKLPVGRALKTRTSFRMEYV